MSLPTNDALCAAQVRGGDRTVSESVGHRRQSVLPFNPRRYARAESGPAGYFNLSCGGCRSGFHRYLALEVAFLVRTSDHRTRLQHFLHQIFAAATRTLFRQRFAGGRELALRIISATVESVALARLFFHEVAIFAERTLHPDEVL